MAPKLDTETSRLDDAARAGWLYYVAGNTQDEIARKLGVSRQSAQRLVSLAVSEKLIKVRLDHPIARCMELSAELKSRYGLQMCEVVPSDPDAPFSMVGVAEAAAAELERQLKVETPQVITLGTGRALRAMVDQVPILNCPQHKIVSLLGNMMSDGSASAYNVVIRLADRINARHYPMPLPVFAGSREERSLLHDQPPVRNILGLTEQASATFVGIGNMGETAPLYVDGFISEAEMRDLLKAGAMGEITSWVYDSNGKLIEGLTNDRVASAPLRPDADHPVTGIAAGKQKIPAILGALKGRLINGLVTNEATAELLLTA
ncbi:sugar-binding transcriptional regulator [Roseibium aestuarii]|uniref:Sugar-binding transcriptional regulator n=1 Tax=Roseibium aestuarii TaxID=2600299 RepID=A0ABW4JWS0_9HYPH|nr:sugar-binding transcriptional regulator [Roseibium aestuarii]